MSLINELEKLVAKASDKAADLEDLRKRYESSAGGLC